MSSSGGGRHGGGNAPGGMHSTTCVDFGCVRTAAVRRCVSHGWTLLDCSAQWLQGTSPSSSRVRVHRGFRWLTQIAWAGFRWLADQQKDFNMRRCAVIAYGAEYGKLHWIREAARISAFLAPADPRRDPQDPWVGFSHSAVRESKGKRDANGNRIPI